MGLPAVVAGAVELDTGLDTGLDTVTETVTGGAFAVVVEQAEMTAPATSNRTNRTPRPYPLR